MAEQSRRSLLKHLGATAGAISIGSLAGCVIFPPDPTGSSGGGLVPGGEIPTVQTVHREDADVVVETADALEDELSLSDGQIIWVPTDATIDLAGRNLTIRNTVLASGRSEGESGALITTDDRGIDSPARDPAMVEIEDGGRITGVELRGPHWDYTDSAVIPAYIPMAPGGSYGVRQQWRDDWYTRAISIRGENAQVDNCEIWGWSAGIAVGGSSTSVSPDILHCAIHNCMMTSAGYPIDVRRGTPTIYRCWFDAYRHALNGSGLADAGYIAIECTFGPHTSSHVLDMHRVDNNQSGSSNPTDLRYHQRAGATMLVRDSQIMPTNIVDDSFHNEGNGYINHRPGGETPHVHVRGIPYDGFYLENNACAHPNPDTGVNQSGTDGYATDGNGWHNIAVGDNQWGVDFSGESDEGNTDDDET